MMGRSILKKEKSSQVRGEDPDDPPKATEDTIFWGIGKLPSLPTGSSLNQPLRSPTVENTASEESGYRINLSPNSLFRN